jgi:hypothetical protein
MKVVVILAGVVLLASCRATRPIQSAVAKRDTASMNSSGARTDSARTVQAVLQALDSARIQFQTFSSKVNVDYRGSDGKNYDVNANIRMQRDSAIWISVNAVLGIEALRALITRDSVKLLDKLNKTYRAHSIDYLQTTTALPLDLPTLQDLIIGNPVFLDSNVIGYTKSPGSISLLVLGKLFKNLISVSEADNTVQHIKLDDANPARARTADLSYAGYEDKDGFRFATKRTISVSEKKKLDIRLDFKQYAFNQPVEFPFAIPKNFGAR